MDTFAKPPNVLELSGNPAYNWCKWKTKFEVFLQAAGLSGKPDEQKVGLLLTHMGDDGLDIYQSFVFLPERDNPSGGDKLPAESNKCFKDVLAKFDAHFTRRDPQ